MRRIITTTALAVAVAATAAGCGGASSPAPRVTVTVTPAPAVASSPPPQASSDAQPLIEALAGSSSAGILSARSLVAGPVMTRYMSFQAIEAEAAEAAGQPGTAGSVTVTAPGSFQTCYPQQGGCQSFTAFSTDAAGRVTGMDVDGQPVAGRLAAGRDDRGGGLAITDVASYLFTSTGTVGFAFHVRNNGNVSVSTDGFLPLFITSGGARLQPDLNASSQNSEAGALGRGQSEALVVIFDTRAISGTFELEGNGIGGTLVSSRLVRVAG
jgi:hypothetical protein